MAIQPIDLQTMYTQLEKVSKMAAHQQQGVQLQKAIQQEEQAKRAQEKHRTVEELNMDKEGLPIVADRNKNASPEEGDEGKNQANAQKDETIPKEFEVIKDPRLGQHIDISG